MSDPNIQYPDVTAVLAALPAGVSPSTYYQSLITDLQGGPGDTRGFREYLRSLRGLQHLTPEHRGWWSALLATADLHNAGGLARGPRSGDGVKALESLMSGDQGSRWFLEKMAGARDQDITYEGLGALASLLLDIRGIFEGVSKTSMVSFLKGWDRWYRLPLVKERLHAVWGLPPSASGHDKAFSAWFKSFVSGAAETPPPPAAAPAGSAAVPAAKRVGTPAGGSASPLGSSRPQGSAVPAVPASEAHPSSPKVLEDVKSGVGEAHEVPDWVPAVLASRGIDTGVKSKSFMYGKEVQSPVEMKGVVPAVQVIRSSVASQGEDGAGGICVFGDYDADGVTSTAVMLRALTRVGARGVARVLPTRFGSSDYRVETGYGVKISHIDQLHREGVRTLVFVDTGATAIKQIAHAKSLGMSVVVLDHHELEKSGAAGGDPLKGDPVAAQADDSHEGSVVVPPGVDAFVDPHQPGERYRNTALSASGVCQRFAAALYKACGVPDKEADALLDIAAIGIVADQMEMTPENRVLVRRAMSRMRRSVFPGVRALAEEIRTPSPGGAGDPSLSAEDIGFVLGPMLNACGRLDRPDHSVDLLMADSDEDARSRVRVLRGINNQRKKLEKDVLALATREADALLQSGGGHKVVVVGGRDWHNGVCGIVASRLVELYGMPAVVLNFGPRGNGGGSARGVQGSSVSVIDALLAAKARMGGSILHPGGHIGAAGFSVQAASGSEEDMKRLVSELQSAVDDYVVSLGDKATVAPGVAEVVPDVEVGLKDVNDRMLQWLHRMEPWGRGQPKPVFLVRGCKVLPGVSGGPAVTVRGDAVFFAVRQDGVDLNARWPRRDIGKGVKVEDVQKWIESRIGRSVDLCFVPGLNSDRDGLNVQKILNVKTLRDSV